MSRRPSERRAATRKRPQTPLHSQLSLDMPTDVRAVASGGVGIRLPFAPELGSRHAFTFHLGQDPIHVEGVVRNCHSLANGNFEVGIEFEGLGAAEQARLDEFVQSKLSR